MSDQAVTPLKHQHCAGLHDNDYVTIITTDKPCNKHGSIDSNGSIVAKSRKNVSSGTATILHVPDISHFESVLSETRNDPNKVLICGYVEGLPIEVEFSIVPKAKHERMVKKGEITQSLDDEFYRDVNGKVYVTRTKDTFTNSSVMLFDYDLGIDSYPAWAEKIDNVFSGFKQADKLVCPSNSSRIHKESEEPVTLDESTKYHCYTMVTDVSGYEDLSHKFLSTAYAKGFGVIAANTNGKPLYRTITDCSVWSAERIVYEGMPTVDNGLKVAPSTIARFGVENQRLDITKIEAVSDIFDTLERKRKNPDGTTTTITIIIDKTRLRMNTMIECQIDNGIELLTVRQIMERYGNDKDLHLRCNIPPSIDGRASTSWNGIIHIGTDGYPTLFDNGTGVLYLVADSASDMFSKHLKDNPSQQPTEAVSSPETINPPPAGGALETLLSNDVSPHAEAYRRSLAEQFFVLGRIALARNITTIYAKPGVGKTLIVACLLNDAIEGKRIDPEKVLLIDADSGADDIANRMDYANKYGYKLIVPNSIMTPELTIDKTIELIRQIVKEGSCEGMIFIFDTLKKFNDVMSKDKSKAFYELVRAITIQGGTVILLAHANKNLTDHGDSVFSGTQDQQDDVDAMYRIEKLDTSNELRTYVQFHREKCRGKNAETVLYSYATKASSYDERLQSVTEESSNELERVTSESDRLNTLKHDQPVIDAILEAIGCGIDSKGGLIDYVMAKDSRFSRRKINTVLGTYEEPTGFGKNNYQQWRTKRGEKGAIQYLKMSDDLNIVPPSIRPPPPPPPPKEG